jgi:hypothetical protein
VQLTLICRRWNQPDGGLMPVADISAIVVNADGHQRTNLAWVIGRLLRDFEYRAESRSNGGSHAVPASGSLLPFVSTKAGAGPVVTGSQPPRLGREKTPREALRVTVFEVDPRHVPGRTTPDWVFYLGFTAIFVQLGLAVIPWALSRNYLPFVVTISGTALTLLTSALPQWGNKKYARYRTGGWTVGITRGNGNRHVMLILGKDHGCPVGLDLEIMAGRTSSVGPSLLTRICMTIFAALSVVLLITVAGMKEDKWCTYTIPQVNTISYVMLMKRFLQVSSPSARWAWSRISSLRVRSAPQPPWASISGT